MNIKEIIKFAQKNGYEDVQFIDVWNGYDCYEGILEKGTNDVYIIGLPLMIMVRGSHIRMSTPDEALQQIKEVKE